MKQVSEGVTQLNNNTSQIQTLGNSIKKLQISLAQVQDGTGKLKDGIGELKTGTDKIQVGSNSLSKGLGELSKNSSVIKTALQKLDDGAKSALDGGNKLTDGIIALKTSIKEGKNTAENQIKKLDGIKEFVEDPVEFKEESFGEVESYGVAFTPLFLSIGLWVGALMCYVVLYYDQENRFKLLGKYAENKFLQIGLYFGIAILQGILTGMLLKLGLGFNVQNTILYYSSCIVIAIAFMSVIQFLIVNFGDIGKFIALIILVLQLAASGGTFPVETIDKGFRIFTNFLPMTYAIRLLKESLVLIDEGVAGKNILMLLAFAVFTLVITLVTRFIKQSNSKDENLKG